MATQVDDLFTRAFNRASIVKVMLLCNRRAVLFTYGIIKIQPHTQTRAHAHTYTHYFLLFLYRASSKELNLSRMRCAGYTLRQNFAFLQFKKRTIVFSQMRMSPKECFAHICQVLLTLGFKTQTYSVQENKTVISSKLVWCSISWHLFFVM